MHSKMVNGHPNACELMERHTPPLVSVSAHLQIPLRCLLAEERHPCTISITDMVGWQIVYQYPSGTHGVRLRDGVDLPCCYFWLVAPRRCSHLGGIICVDGDDLCTQGLLLLLLSERELLSAQFLLFGVLLLLRHLLQEWRCLVAYSHTVRLHSRIWDVHMKAEIRQW